MIDPQKFTETTQITLANALELARSNQNSSLEEAHLLQSLIQVDGPSQQIIQTFQIEEILGV